LLFPVSLIISSLAISDFSKFLEAITTLAPSLANSKAADFPIPVFPPVKRRKSNWNNLAFSKYKLTVILKFTCLRKTQEFEKLLNYFQMCSYKRIFPNSKNQDLKLKLKQGIVHISVHHVAYYWLQNVDIN